MTIYRAERGFEKNELPLPEGTALFCGTTPAIGGIRRSARFEMELEDPIKKGSLRHEVVIKTLPTVS
jgi:hypothetical protein